MTLTVLGSDPNDWTEVVRPQDLDASVSGGALIIKLAFSAKFVAAFAAGTWTAALEGDAASFGLVRPEAPTLTPDNPVE